MSKANDLKFIAEKYQLVREQSVDPKVVQFIDQMQIPGFPGAQFAQLFKANDPYDSQALQALQSVIQKGITPQKFREIFTQVLMPEIQKAMQQGLNQMQITQQMQANPHIMAQYYTAAAQKALQGLNAIPNLPGKPTTPGAASTPSTPQQPQQRVGGGFRSA